MALAKLIALGITLVVGFGGVNLIDEQMTKEEEVSIKVMQEYTNQEESLTFQDFEPITNVYAQKDITEMTDEGKIITYRLYNDGSKLLMNEGQYIFLPKEDESRQVASNSLEDILNVIDKYIEYYGLKGDYSQNEIDLEEYKKNHGHYDEIVGNDDCEACKVIYPQQ